MSVLFLAMLISSMSHVNLKNWQLGFVELKGDKRRNVSMHIIGT